MSAYLQRLFDRAAPSAPQPAPAGASLSPLAEAERRQLLLGFNDTARPFPLDATAADLVHWQPTLLVEDAERAFAVLRQAGSVFVSPRVVAPGEPRLGFRRGFMVKDPDGHALRLVER